MTKVRKKPKKNITKNINKKSFIQNTPNIAEKLDNEMVAFLDTEFLTSQVKGGPPAKLVSVGFVVCGKDFSEDAYGHSDVAVISSACSPLDAAGLFAMRAGCLVLRF